MSDNYQAVYDAIRSRFHCDAQAAIELAAREAFVMAPHYMASVAQDASIAAAEHGRPCVVFKPKLMRDGNQWCALYGEDLQVGVAGFGDSPAKAMTDFDNNWLAPIAANPAAAKPAMPFGEMPAFPSIRTASNSKETP